MVDKTVFMGCNCKGGNKQILNNLESKDHLNLAYEVYRDVIKKKTIEEMDDLDQKQVLFGFYSLYPNANGEVSVEHAINTIKSSLKPHYNGIE
jgi:hypothetical protein